MTGGLDLAVCLGGDGTFLRAVELVGHAGVPVLGVNVGHLAYLALVEPDELDLAVDRFLAGDDLVQERMLLEVALEPVDGPRRVVHHALNEAVVRAAGAHVVHVEVAVDGERFTTFAADALLVATPTGSTAYNLSARGPILAPELQALVVTPVAPHQLFDRSLVLGPDDEVRLELLGWRPGRLQCDGDGHRHARPRRCRGVPARPMAGQGGAARSSRLPQHAAAEVRAGRPLMLEELRARDLGVIAEVTLTLGPGMTAITGETGAGKTLVVEAVGLLCGGRADAGVVRAGATEAVVEGRFRLAGTDPATADADADAAGAAGGADDPGEAVLRRVVLAAGRSRAYVDGGLATVAEIAARGGLLVDLHGQHAHQSLLAPATQRAGARRLRRRRPGAPAWPPAPCWPRWRRRGRSSAATPGPAPARSTSCATRCASSTPPAWPTPTRTTALSEEEDRLADATAHREAAAAAHHALGADGAAVDAGGHRRRRPARPGPAREPPSSGSVGLLAELGDVAGELRDLAEELEDDPARLAVVGARRQLLADLRRRYGDTLAEVMAFHADAEDRLRALEQAEVRAGRLDDEQEAARGAVDRAAEPPCWPPVGPAPPALAAAVESRLRLLAMPRARVEVDVAGADGADVRFLLAANPGEPAAAAGQGGLRRRAGPGHAGAAPGAPRRRRPHAGVRRGRRRHRRRGRARRGPGPGRPGPRPPGAGRHPPRPGGRLRRRPGGWPRRPRSTGARCPPRRPSTATPGCASSPACWRAPPTPHRPGGAPPAGRGLLRRRAGGPRRPRRVRRGARTGARRCDAPVGGAA